MNGQSLDVDAMQGELRELEVEIARQRLIRERSTYKLEQLLRERDRLGRHLTQAQADAESA